MSGRLWITEAGMPMGIEGSTVGRDGSLINTPDG